MWAPRTVLPSRASTWRCSRTGTPSGTGWSASCAKAHVRIAAWTASGSRSCRTRRMVEACGTLTSFSPPELRCCCILSLPSLDSAGWARPCHARPLMTISPLRRGCALTCCNSSPWCLTVAGIGGGFTRSRWCSRCARPAVVAGMASFTAIAGWATDVPAELLVKLYGRRCDPPSKATIWRVVTSADAAMVDAGRACVDRRCAAPAAGAPPVTGAPSPLPPRHAEDHQTVRR